MKSPTTGGAASCVAALIATRNRPELLKRAIASIISQTRKPDLLVVVDDARPEERAAAVPQLTALLADSGIELITLKNRRSPGPSGAWNSGLDELQRRHEDPSRIHVAMLDDDDEWCPDHLARCEAAGEAGRADLVVSGLIRADERHPEGRRQEIPPALDADQLLSSGQHIQGSNLYVRLSVLLEAGLFSEELSSCTDRDLCLKLLDLGTVRFASTQCHTVRHHADGRADRCSTPGSPQKLEGLTGFWRKWRHRVTPAVEAAFLARAERLFGWKGLTEAPASTSLAFRASSLPSPIATGEKVSLVVGFITDTQSPAKAKPIFEWLLKLSFDPRIAQLQVVLVENGPRPPAGAEPLRELVILFRRRGLACFYADHDQQRTDAGTSLFEVGTESIGRERLPIAVTRTMLAVYAARTAERMPGTWTWLIDDDYRPYALVDRGEAQPERISMPDLDELLRLQRAGQDIVIGQLTGAAPLPFLATLRTQLLDLSFTLQAWSRSVADAALSDRAGENHAFRIRYRDYYYDMARADYRHLESPIWLAPANAGETRADAAARIAGLIGRLPFGEQVFRPCLLPGTNDTADQGSILRGGSALFFRPKHLLKFPNLLARLGGRHVRRSDMVSTILAQEVDGLRIVASRSIAGFHDRAQVQPGQADFKNLLADVWGYAVYSTLKELWSRRLQSGSETTVECSLEFSAAEVAWSTRRFLKLLNERMAAASLSLWRVRGLAKALRQQLAEAEAANAWWLPTAGLGQHVRSLCDWVEDEIGDKHIRRFKQSLTEMKAEHWSEFLTTLKSRHEQFQTGLAVNSTIRPWLEAQNRANVQHRIEGWLGVGPLQFLGQGMEGMVFTDGTKCFKHIRVKETVSVARRCFLRAQVGVWTSLRVLAPLESHHEAGGELVLVYPYEPSEPYQGGLGPDLVQLLKECRANGIVCRNVHPKNLRVTKTGLRFADYGHDLAPWSEPEFRMMAKRAWLSLRWPHRPDLSEIMSRALKAEVLPELGGFENFWAALEAQGPEEVLRTLLDEETRKLKPSRVLDYGCGKGKLARLLGRHVPEVVCYDPDAKLATRWQSVAGQSSGLSFTNVPPQIGGQFDVVICSLVLCELPDGPDYDRVLVDLRKAVCRNGHVFVAVCNPAFTFGGPTSLHTRRHLPAAACYCQNFRLEEWVDPPGVLRIETHRPLRRLQRDLLSVGLVCEQVWQTKAVDQERFEPASDFLVMRLRPRPESAPPVSLLIKTCAMEWETLEVQVHHLVRQLERPRCFAERVLIVDRRRDGFLRQCAEGDYARLQLAISRLQAEGWIDRVVIAPDAPDDVRELYRRWFGQEHANTHAANGAQLAAMLAGFEACTSEHIFHVDSDVLVFRQDGKDDYLGELLAVMDQDPLAVTVSLSIACREPQEFTADGPSGPWRTESRAGLVHRARLLAACPLENPLTAEGFLLPWHRTVDRSVQRGTARAYRGANPSTYYIHPPNEFKRSRDAWMVVLDAVERGRIPPLQLGMPELFGNLEQWLAPERNEPFIFLICGRNVAPGRMWRCLDSLFRQTRRDWGAIVVDDASNEESSQFIELLCQPQAERITLVRAPQRRGQLANMVLAIRQLCGNPDSVILTLDLDDALLGEQALERVAQAYCEGADLTVGSMLRTDMHRNYPVNFNRPRQNRGGNVWQHLRTFKKRLFDQLPDACLRLDGQYVEVAQDWAYMIPLVELAKRPVWIQEALYLHEPSGVGKGTSAAERDRVIGRLLTENVLFTSSPQDHE